MTAVKLREDGQLRVVTDTRTGRIVFGPGTEPEVSTWIIRTGFWRGGDLRVDVLDDGTGTPVSAWADPLSPAERQELAGKLERACRRFFSTAITTLGEPRLHEAMLIARDECEDLHEDVTR